MKRKKKAAAAAIAPAAETVTGTVGDTLTAAQEKVAPYLDDAVEKVAPYVEDAKEKLSPFLDEAIERLTPYVEDAKEKLSPYFEQAREKGGDAAAQAFATLSPAVDDASKKARKKANSLKGGAVDAWEDDLRPRLDSWLAEIEKNPDFSKAAHALSGGRLARPEPKKKGRKGLVLLAIVGLGGLAFIAVRQLTGKKSDWEHYPAAASWNPSNDFTVKPAAGDAAKGGSEQKATDVDVPRADEPAGAKPEPTEPATSKPAAAPTPKPTAAPTPKAESTPPLTPKAAAQSPAPTPRPAAESTPPAAPKHAAEGEARTGSSSSPHRTAGTASGASYGADAYVGSEPPLGYTVKGNERSMQFHTPESDGYDRTIADVWFTGAEAAEKAGFTRAEG